MGQSWTEPARQNTTIMDGYTNKGYPEEDNQLSVDVHQSSLQNAYSYGHTDAYSNKEPRNLYNEASEKHSAAQMNDMGLKYNGTSAGLRNHSRKPNHMSDRGESEKIKRTREKNPRHSSPKSQKLSEHD